jgi:hypothetical protein
VVTEGDAAVHAAGGLLVELLRGIGVDEFIIVVPPFLDGTFGREVPGIFEKSCWFAHVDECDFGDFR